VEAVPGRGSWYDNGPGQAAALARLRAEHADLLAALDCDVAPPYRFALAAALSFHWCVGGFLSEGRRQMDRALAVAPEPTPARGRALLAAIWVAQTQGDLAAAGRWLDEAEALASNISR
jgi:hypothetical protein